jgi:hypothetical protein
VDKILLLSILLGTIALPARAARDKNPRAGLRRAILWIAIFNVLYVISLRFLWHRLS